MTSSDYAIQSTRGGATHDSAIQSTLDSAIHRTPDPVIHSTLEEKYDNAIQSTPWQELLSCWVYGFII